MNYRAGIGELESIIGDCIDPYSAQSYGIYLERCQVDTPSDLVREVWDKVFDIRKEISTVVDFGAGDGRFAHVGKYDKYVGYEIDLARCEGARLPGNAKIIEGDAFEAEVWDADLCIGNPPYVRNQDLPLGWRIAVSEKLFNRLGVKVSGLANAWQYFFLLALASTNSKGVVALVIPYEWVSRPSAAALREYISLNGWSVSVYRLRDDVFSDVITTASITVLDKTGDGSWKFFEQRPDGSYVQMLSEAGDSTGVLAYSRRSIKLDWHKPYAKRGLSPGTQEVLTLTEGDRAHFGLQIGRDVVPCVTTLRWLTTPLLSITENVFEESFRSAGMKCWLINTSTPISNRLREYLDSIPPERYQTQTCLKREEWWRFTFPKIPALLAASGFVGKSPKVYKNSVGAVAVGGVSGIYGISKRNATSVVKALRCMDLTRKIVPHSNGLLKVEINQLNTILNELNID